MTIMLIQDHLSDEEYMGKMAACHVVFLPYDSKAYAARTSGIFVEAIVAHKTPFVKKGTWLADELTRFDLPELILDWDLPNFFSQIFAILADEVMQKKLALMQRAYAQFHSMEQFQTQIGTLL
jgi:hypothetical protein